jgi:hypothetical protein
VPREKRGRKGEKTVTEEIKARQTAEETRSTVESGQGADTGGARRGAENSGAGFNRYLYENLLCNIECTIELWNRMAARHSNPESAHALWQKAEGLGYAIRLLYAFQPQFEELVASAEGLSCKGCGAKLDQSANRLPANSDLCDSCYEIGRDGQTSLAERAGNSVPLTNLAAE